MTSALRLCQTLPKAFTTSFVLCNPIQNIDPDGRELMGYMVSLYTKIWGDRDRAYAFAGSHKVGRWDYSPSRYRLLYNKVTGKSGLGRTEYRPTVLRPGIASFRQWAKGVHEKCFSAEGSTPVDSETQKPGFGPVTKDEILLDTISATLDSMSVICAAGGVACTASFAGAPAAPGVFAFATVLKVASWGLNSYSAWSTLNDPDATALDAGYTAGAMLPGGAVLKLGVDMSNYANQ